MIKVMQLLRTERQGHHLIVQIPPHWDGLTIEHVLRDLWQVPKKMRHEWRMERAILLNNKPVPFHEILKKGDRMSVPVFTGPELNIKPQIMDLSVLFEDDHFLIVNKKAGLPTHPNHPDDQNTLLNGVYAYLKKKGSIRTDLYPACPSSRPGNNRSDFIRQTSTGKKYA